MTDLSTNPIISQMRVALNHLSPDLVCEFSKTLFPVLNKGSAIENLQSAIQTYIIIRLGKGHSFEDSIKEILSKSTAYPDVGTALGKMFS